MNLPAIPPKRDYVVVKVHLNNGQSIVGCYCRRWGFRDANFDAIQNIVRWEYYETRRTS
jgi:hypothetical protein